MNNKVLPFDIKKKYVNRKELNMNDYRITNNMKIPVFKSLKEDKFGNLIGETISGVEVLIKEKDDC